MQRHHHFQAKGFRALESFCKLLSSVEGYIGRVPSGAVLQPVLPWYLPYWILIQCWIFDFTYFCFYSLKFVL